MDQLSKDNEGKIREKLLNSRFYRPLNRCFQIEWAIRDYTMYVIDGAECFVQPLFQQSTDGTATNQPNAAPAFDNFATPLAPPPRPSRPSTSQFDETTVTEDGKRICQLCRRAYKNRRHRNMYGARNTCCICRATFATAELLIQHNEQTIRKKICCVKHCNVAICDDYESNKYHFDYHNLKKGNFCANCFSILSNNFKL